MEYWAKPGLDRSQTLLLYPTLDDSVSEGHPVRQLEEILKALDWSAWTQTYNGRVGQPPIPPWVMAGVILYGLMRRIRSSRQLEYACGHNIDFMWLAEGRRIDHSTFCEFRTKFKEPLKELFKQVGRVAMGMGFIRLLEVAFDGTRVKANASRFHTWTAEKVEAVLQELETQVAEMLKEAEAADASETGLRDDRLPQALPPELADAKERQEKMRQILERLREADAARKKDGIKTPAQMPKADTDSTVMPNKEGRYAPNYTPTVATDGAADFIVDCDVIPGPNEQNELLSTADRIEDNFDKKIENLSADKAFGTGANLEGMETRHVNFHTPVESPAPEEGNPAKREDPRQPVPETEWAQLPRNDKDKLAKSCFVYDAEANCYYCPMGRVLGYEQAKREKGRRRGTSIGAGTARDARWRRCAAIKTPSEGEAFRGTSTNPCGSGCTPRCRPKRHGRSTTDGCTSARPRLRSSKTFLRCVVFSCEGWRRSARNGAGCVRPTT